MQMTWQCLLKRTCIPVHRSPKSLMSNESVSGLETTNNLHGSTLLPFACILHSFVLLSGCGLSQISTMTCQKWRLPYTELRKWMSGMSLEVYLGWYSPLSITASSSGCARRGIPGERHLIPLFPVAVVAKLAIIPWNAIQERESYQLKRDMIWIKK